MREYFWNHENLGAASRRHRRASLGESLIAIGVVALAGCGEIVPVNPSDGGAGNDGAPADAVSPDNADLAILDLGAYGDLSPAFDPAETSYRATFSLLVQGLEVTAVPVNPDSTVAVNGVEIVPGQRADDVSLDAAGDTPINIEVRSPSGNRKTYNIVAGYGGPIEQRVYGKASNPGGGTFNPFNPGDEFGFWMDTDDDTIVVGAHREGSSARTIDGDQNDEAAPAAGAAYVFRRQNNTWKQEAYLKAFNTDAFDEFGRSVAIDDNVVVVGAPGEDSNASGVDGNGDSDGLGNSGAVYVFRRTGDQWVQEAYVKPSDPQGCALFGLHVAIDDEVLVVGAPGCFDFGNPDGDTTSPNDGAAYVFRYDGVTWAQEAILKASNPDRGDQFGFQVSVDDDLIGIGAIGESSSIGGDSADPAASDNNAPLSGAAYAFERQPDGNWVQTDYIKPPAPTGRRLPPPDCLQTFECEGDRFGIRVVVDEDTMVVGGFLEDSGARAINGDQLDESAVDAGAAWVYRRNGDATWSLEAYLKPDNLDPADFFGQFLDISGDLLAVAANAESSGSTGVGQDGTGNDAPSSGAVYLFQRQDTTWQQIEYIKASNTESGDNFGFNLALSSNLLVVGSFWESGGSPGIGGEQSDESAPLSGAMYIFQ